MVKVSISGIAFVVDNGAYLVLKEYLDKLNAGYAKNPDGREIVADIEARIAELILSEQEGDKVVGKALVDSIVAQLGFPDDMDAGEDIPVENIPKRLYRNPEGAVLGGVCSGLGTYFRVDPVWIRLGIFLPLLFAIFSAPFRVSPYGNFFGSLFGVFILLYIILWIAIPMARNPRQKLEMRGEKITASSIREGFMEDAQAMSRSPKRERSQSVWADLMYGIGRVLQVLLKICVIFVAVIFGIVAVSLLVAIIAVLFSGGTALSGLTLEALSDMEGITPAAYATLLMLVVLIPMIAIVYILIKGMFGRGAGKPFLTTTGIIWLIILVFLVAASLRNIDNLRHGIEELIEDFDGREPLRHDSGDWDEKEWREEWDGYRREIPEGAGSGEGDAAQEPAEGEWKMEIRESGKGETKSKSEKRSGRIRITNGGVDIQIALPYSAGEELPVVLRRNT